MFTVVQNNNQYGEGMNFNTFITRFDEIVSAHIEAGRAKAFAFIFYDFEDDNLRRILTDGYQDLDRLSGRDLTIFYFNSTSREEISNFNNIVANPYMIEDSLSLPCVVFFKVIDKEVSEIKVIHLLEHRFLSLFDELFNAIRNYINNGAAPKATLARRPNIDLLKIGIEQFFKFVFDNIYKSI